MLWSILGAVANVAVAGTATLHVGVHRQAGEVYDVAADGAAGLCVAGPARITCPADGEVRFRWAGTSGFVLEGETVVDPGEVGVAWVLADETLRESERAQLASGVTREVVQALFSPAPGVAPVPPSRGMIDDLERLARHPDPLVRRAVIDALMPLWRHTASDAFHPDAPELIAGGVITRLAGDVDTRVRRRLAFQLKELRDPDVEQRAEAIAALLSLVDDTRPPVQRAALVSMRSLSEDEVVGGERGWAGAMQRVKRPGGPGRAAANTLAFLANTVEPSDAVVPDEAVHAVLVHHRERAWKVWFAWREHLPFEEGRARTLLWDTVGLHRGLIRHWADSDPEGLARLLRSWESSGPHSDRWRLVAEFLSDNQDAGLRTTLGLPPLATEATAG